MELSVFNKQLEEVQNLLIANNELEGIYGDGKNLVNNKDIPITHNFSDQLYMRTMRLSKGAFIISA